jgi:hypothetical protein
MRFLPLIALLASVVDLQPAGLSRVTPDELIRPTADDLTEGRDPALARAAAILELNLNPATAGAMFPIEWR